MKPTKKPALSKRTLKHKPPAETPAAPASEECANVVMADPEAEDRKLHPEKYRKGLPAGRITVQCGKCGNASVVFVDDPDSYDEKARVLLFRDRGASYKPPVCGFCKRREARSKSAA